MKKLFLSAALAALVAVPGYTAQPTTAQDFTITFSADGEISGTLDGLQLVDELKVSIEGIVELHDLAPALLQRHVLRQDRSKRKEVWLDRLEIVGNELIVRGGGRYEERLRLLFRGWTRLYSQSGSVEVRLRAATQQGVPVVHVSHVNVDLGGLLGNAMKILNLDKSIERIARPLIQAELNRQIAANVPESIGKIGKIHVEDLKFVSLGQGRYGVRLAASATIDLK